MLENFVINGRNPVPKGTVIYEKGQPLQSVGLILKGRVVVDGDGVHTTLSSGNFLGMCDVMQGKHSFTFVALDDCVIYGLPITEQKQAGLLLDEKPQYRGLLVTSVNFFYQDIVSGYMAIKQQAESLLQFVSETYQNYLQAAEKNGLVPETISAIETLQQQAEQKPVLPERLTYFMQCCRIPIEAQRNYYGANAYVAKSYFQEQCKVLPDLLAACHTSTDLLKKLFNVMIMGERNLFSLVSRMALGLKKAGQNDEQLSAMLDKILENINDSEKVLLDKAGCDMNLDRTRMEETYFALLSDEVVEVEEYSADDLKLLDNSLQQIIDYAPVHGRVAEEFTEVIEKFGKMPDPFVKNPEAGSLRKKISSLYFELYEAVLKKSFDDPQMPTAVRLFLRFGYVSEKLLKEEELQMLLSFPDFPDEQMEHRVYTLPEWLYEIYKMRKNPSKNEFDLDYEEDLRVKLQEHKITEQEHRKAMEDGEQRLHFEIDNLYRYADRLLNGNISAFVPILCSDGIFNKLNNTFVTPMVINQTVNKIEKIDYSIFYREHFEAYEEAGLNRLEVIERYTPEFILFPVYGRNGLMWQDLEGRNKSSHARILLPSFMEQDLSGVILKMMAHYRWERCRTEMGAQWNNFRYPSLTSEYTDYLQFYKKNNELTPDRREKVKAQLQQCNNKYRDVFTKDYQDWILREAAGALKLNRVAREIMYTYCPLSQSVAKDLLEQTAYKDAARRFMVERGKKEKAFQSSLRRFEKANVEIPEEVEQTRRYMMES